MITLTEEQRRKIEENRAAAILKKQQAFQKLNNASESHNLNTTKPTTGKNYFENKFKKSPAKLNFENKTSTNVITAVCKVYGENRFLVDMPYHEPSVEIFRSVNDRKYEPELKLWSFPLTEHSALVTKLKTVSPDVVVNAVPESVVKVLLECDAPDSVQVNWNKIDKTLRNYLMPFQVEGIKFGIGKKGKCLIADDMGLGKTIQALGIVHYFKENWPLLIVCPSSMRFPWQEAIRTFLPSVEASVQVVTTGKGQVIEGDIVILSYDLMKSFSDDLQKKKFGVLIFDESHMLKNSKSIRTTVALQLAATAKNIILLSGTPALSRPQELYPQIFAVDPFTFKKFFEFGMRYCNGKKDKFGWNFSGSSNLEELELYLKKKIMIRRLKSEVIKQLPSKIRKVVVLHPNMVKAVKKKIQKLESEYYNSKGTEKHSTLMSYYALSGNAKLNAVCEYIEDKLETSNKFIIFAHHVNVINGICDLLVEKKVDFIRIDGSVSSESRKNFCDKFQSQDKCRVAVLSIKAANCGLTLTAAQLVIFAELYWNPGDLTQAEDRAHRIGQQDSVLVEYLIAKSTADEHLWKLIEVKLNILNKVGLSKDSFKDTDHHDLDDPFQPKITSMLQSGDENSEKKITEIVDNSADMDGNFADADADDIFSNINLEEIEKEYLINNKRRKTAEV